MKKRKRAITDLNDPNGSRDILFHSQEFERNERRHVVRFQPHFYLNMTSQMQPARQWKSESALSEDLLFDLFALQAIRT